MDIRYPDITVKLTDTDGNAFTPCSALVRRGLADGGVEPSEVSAFLAEATSGDYDHLLQTCAEWVELTRESTV